MSNSRGTAGRRWRGVAVVAVITAGFGVAVFGFSGNAIGGGATQTFCSGTVKPEKKKKPGVDGAYQFSCNEAVRAFTIYTNKQFDFFGSETEVIGPPEVVRAESAQIQCEGSVPGQGFGCGLPNRNNGGAGTTTKSQPADCQGSACTKKLSAGAILLGKLGFTKSPCDYADLAKSQRTKVNLTVVTEPRIESTVPPAPTAPAGTPDSVQNTYGVYSSPPFTLKVKGWGHNLCSKGGGGKKKK